jgi:hypothetical protein
MLTLLTFPSAAQHVSTHTAFEVAEIAESIIPAYWTYLCKSIAVCGPHAFFVLVFKQSIEIISINVSVQQLVVADFALGQGLAQHHAQPHASHVWAIPMFV